MALLSALCERCEDLPDLTLLASGAGAGTRDTPGRPNLTRVLVGTRPAATGNDHGEPAVIIEANVDDLDPRLWPGVLASLLAAGAADAWLTPMIMKKGRPAYTLGVLGRPDQAAQLRSVIFSQTSSIGVRVRDAAKFALPRGWVEVTVPGGSVAIKIAVRKGLISQLEVEFDDVARLAAHRGVAERVVLREAQTAADHAGLVIGAPVPAAASSPTALIETGGDHEHRLHDHHHDRCSQSAGGNPEVKSTPGHLVSERARRLRFSSWTVPRYQWTPMSLDPAVRPVATATSVGMGTAPDAYAVFPWRHCRPLRWT